MSRTTSQSDMGVPEERDLLDAGAVLRDLEDHRVRVWRDGEKIRMRGPRKPPDALLERVHSHKPALLFLLGTPPPAPEPPETPEAARTPGDIVFECSRVFGPGLRLIVGGLDAPARPTARTRPRSSRTGESGGPSDAA